MVHPGQAPWTLASLLTPAPPVTASSPRNPPHSQSWLTPPARAARPRRPPAPPAHAGPPTQGRACRAAHARPPHIQSWLTPALSARPRWAAHEGAAHEGRRTVSPASGSQPRWSAGDPTAPAPLVGRRLDLRRPP